MSAAPIPELEFIAAGPDEPDLPPAAVDALATDPDDDDRYNRYRRRDEYAIAIHEGGHAVAQYRLGYEFHSVTIIPEGDFDGVMRQMPPSDEWDSDDLEFAPTDADDDNDDVNFEDDGFFTANERKRLWRYYRAKYKVDVDPLNSMVVSLAGPVAEAIHSGRPLDEILKDGGAGDFDQIEKLLFDQGVRFKADIQQAVVKLERDTSELVCRHWTDIGCIADALMVCRYLSFDKFVAYLDTPTEIRLAGESPAPTSADQPSSAPTPKPSFEIAAEHIQLLTGSADTPMCFRLLPVLPYKRSKLVGTITELWAQIETAQSAGQSIFIVVNGGGHDGDAIDHLRALFIDCDGTAEPPTTWHIEPDFLLHRDATHWHAYWRLDIQKSDYAEQWEVVTGQWEDAQRRLAAHYDTDKGVHDLPRLMRLAGSLHLKDLNNPYLVRIEARRVESPRSGRELMAGIPLLPEPSVRLTPSPASGEPVSLEIVRNMLRCISPDRHRDTLPPDVGWRDLVVSIMSAPGPDEADLREVAHVWMSCELNPGVVVGGNYRGEEDIDHIIKTMPPGGAIGFGTLVKIARAAGYTGPISIVEQERLDRFLARVVAAYGGGAPPVRQAVYEASQASTELARRRVTEEKQLAAERALRWRLA